MSVTSQVGKMMISGVKCNQVHRILCTYDLPMYVNFFLARRFSFPDRENHFDIVLLNLRLEKL